MTTVEDYLTPSGIEPWQIRAACADSDPELFTTDELTLGVQLICARCPVQGECLDFALRHDERFGVWGGVTPAERRRLRRALRRATQSKTAGPVQARPNRQCLG